MGSGNSHHQTATHYLDPAIIHEPPPAPYPDMNMIFKSIPKMMQVADDMHRMSNYMMDLRNMMFGCSVLSVFGILLFLLMKYLHGKKGGTSRRRQRRAHHNNHRSDDSEQSSLSIGRPMIGGAGGNSGGYRHYHAARAVDDGWAAHTTAAGMGGTGGSGADSAPPRVMVDSTSTRHTHVGTPQHGGGGISSTTAPLLMNTPTKGFESSDHHGYHPIHQQHQQYAMALRDAPSPHHQSPTSPPPPTTTTCPSVTGVANGQLKRLDPAVKLVVDEMPYMEENNNTNEQD